MSSHPSGVIARQPHFFYLGRGSRTLAPRPHYLCAGPRLESRPLSQPPPALALASLIGLWLQPLLALTPVSPFLDHPSHSAQSAFPKPPGSSYRLFGKSELLTLAFQAVVPTDRHPLVSPHPL